MTVFASRTHSVIDQWLIGILVFLLPINKQVIPWLITLLVLNRLLAWEFGVYNAFYRKGVIWLFVAPYLVLLLGMLHTDNQDSGWFDLQVKLSLLIFPLILPVVTAWSKASFHTILNCFVGGCVSAAFLCLGVGLYAYLQTGNTEVLFYDQLSLIHHAGYFAMYLNFAVVIIFWQLLVKSVFSVRTLVLIACLLLLTTTVFLLASKAGVVTLAILIIGFTIGIVVVRKSWGLAGAIVAGGLLLSVSFYYGSSRFQGRVDEMVSVLKGQSPLDNEAGRVPIWKAGMRAMAESPFMGHGTGDVKDVMRSQYELAGHEKGIDKNLNAHNQFIQISIAIGLIGGLLIFLGIMLPFFAAVRRQNIIYGAFLLIVLVNMLTESILETQAGVVFYGFFNSLLYLSMYAKSSEGLTSTS